MVNKTKKERCKVIYNNFDTLEVSFQGCLSTNLLNKLNLAKKEAQEIHADVPVTFNGKIIQVRPAGIPYYKYAFSTGDDGELWFVKHSEATGAWNIQVKIHSAAFASYGYAGAKERLYEWLDVFGATIIKESIKRVDFCVDFIAPEFKLDTMQFSAPTSTLKRAFYSDDEDLKALSESGVGRSLQTVTVGKMPGRQICVYNKRAEITKKNKGYWWQIWGVEDKKTPVWRVEVRAGKDHLKEYWQVSTFAELEEKIGQIFLHALNAISYKADDVKDSNISRQEIHEIWNKTICTVKKYFSEKLRPYCKPVIHAIKEQKIREYMRQFQGMATGLASLLGYSQRQLADEGHDALTTTLYTYFSNDEKQIRQSIERTYNRIKDKYCFFDGETGEIVL